MSKTSQENSVAPLCSAEDLQCEPRVRELLARLATAPPQVLLLEGGEPSSRKAMALYWACLLNCEAPDQGAPCLECHSCRKMLLNTHRDLFFLDGSRASIKIDEVREVRGVLGDPPRDAQYRIVVLYEAQVLVMEAANALLKSLEEPRPYTRYILCAPQRERLLPTLVSRSWVATLSWGDPLQAARETGVQQWVEALAGCSRDGRNWMSRTSGKGAVDRPTAQMVYLEVQRELLRALLHKEGQSGLAGLLGSKLDTTGKRQLDETLAQGLLALDHQVNAALTLDWLAVTLYRLLRQ